jgi:predicted RNase H-like HicB family nuclease
MATDNFSEHRARELATRPYTFTLTQGEDAVWTAQVLELPGVIAEGDTADEAIAEGREALSEMLAYYLDEGRTIPEPFETRAFSGRTELRLNPELHRRVVKLAAEQGVSLNRWLAAAVADAAASGRQTATVDRLDQLVTRIEQLTAGDTSEALRIAEHEAPYDTSTP